MKMTMIKSATFAFIFGFCFMGCSSSEEQQEEYMESTEEEGAAEAGEASEGESDSEEEAMEQGEQGEDGYVASEEEESQEEVEEPTLPEEKTIAEAPVEAQEEMVEESEPEEVAETMAAPEKWSPEGNSGESFDYVIKRGDTVSGVAQMVYGSYSQWREISNASGLSNPDLIFPGSILKVPLINDKSRQFNESYAENSAESGEKITVTVEEGDTLSSIAEAQLGDSSNWSHIYGQNRGNISDPDMIRVGQVLTFANNAH